MKLEHPAIIEQGDGWVRFKQESQNTLDEVLPSSDEYWLDGLTRNNDGTWTAKYIPKGPDVKSIASQTCVRQSQQRTQRRL